MPIAAYKPLEIARNALTTDRRLSAGARKAATVWLEYIEEGYSLSEASELLRLNGAELGFTPHEIATGSWKAAACMKLGYSQASEEDMLRFTVPASERDAVLVMLNLRDNMVYSRPLADPYPYGWIGRGARVMPHGENLRVQLLPGHPCTPKIEKLMASSA